ncbi:beta-ketoacyl synthase N-terminal-like domain-containing protein [Couchioplanes azureus]|uniref:beta-ketoacyl synthase N-terminal-like domain-containing protein n=1 Tax=Couchioplanes caeruleus TaxID=56438 RepID=UPI0016714D69|nr:beta-ketoacyl synthase N-terminal-like domain-containing protein [Couchioplanes caeruleus]GGQ65139.1 coronafacic acid synthetase [Couchioplanes caeruleus subsp. azureus]
MTVLIGPPLLGRGEVALTDDIAARHSRPSFYADPAAWLAVEAVAAALGEAGAAVAQAGEDVGVLAISATATTRTMRAIRRTAAAGRVSPLRFAGANPGSLAGLVCIEYGFRGPSLTLSMPPEQAWPVPVIRQDWLDGPCRYVVTVTHRGGPEGPEVAEAVVHGGSGS